MPKPGYTQSPEHKKKRLAAIEGDGNGSYKDGRRSYRRRAGAKDNDGTVVHHKNGDRTNNSPSNLERLTDGNKTPGRRTTPMHEKTHKRGSHTDSIATRIAVLHHDRKTGGCGKGKVGDGSGHCRQAKLSQVTPFSHRTPAEADAANREKLLWKAGQIAIGIGVTGGGLAALAHGKRSGDHPYHDPPPEVEVPAPPKSVATIAPPIVVQAAPAVQKPEDKGIAAPLSLPKEEKKARKKLIEKLLSLPSAGGTTEMPLSEHSKIIYSHHLLPSEQTNLGKPGGRRSKETKEFESKPGHYRSVPVKGVRFKAKNPSPKVSRLLSQIPGKITSNDKESRRLFRKRINQTRRGISPSKLDSSALSVPLTIALTREDALCDRKHGWIKGAGKCVRSKKKLTPSLSVG